MFETYHEIFNGNIKESLMNILDTINPEQINHFNKFFNSYFNNFKYKGSNK
jgi:hypothetical protein